MARKTEGVAKVGVNISLTQAEKLDVEARAKRAWTPRVRVVRAAVRRALELDARPFGEMIRKLMPQRTAGEKMAVLYVELPAAVFNEAAKKVGPENVADLCRRALLSFLADPAATLS